jgi:hypothetical protein
MRIVCECLASLFKDGDGELAADGWKLIQEDLQGVAFFEIVEEVLDGYPRTGEHRCAALNVRINDDEGRVHGLLPF